MRLFPAEGFQTTEHSRRTASGRQDVRVDLTLSPGQATQTVTVTAEARRSTQRDAPLGGTVTEIRRLFASSS